MAQQSNSSDRFGTWSQYFQDVSRFLESTEHQYRIANQEFCDYVLGRLELCTSTCMQLSDHLAHGASDNDEDRHVIDDLRTNLVSLVECLRCVHSQWLKYEEILDIQTNRFRYQAGRSAQGRGRPKFQIEKEQLVYLSTLHFSWIEIASLLGVSRMTIYR